MTHLNPITTGRRINFTLHLSQPRKRLCLLLMSVALSAAPARAGEAIFSFSGALGGYVNGVGGWSFQPQQNISVTALGCFDFAVTATGPTSIGLWAADGSLLASNLVTTASSLFDQTRYEPIDPLELLAGQTYSIGAYGQSGTTIVYGIPAPEGSVTLSPEIQLGTAVIGVGGFVYPATTAGGEGSAILGPNFEFVVPEPSALALCCLGALGLALKRLRA